MGIKNGATCDTAKTELVFLSKAQRQRQRLSQQLRETAVLIEEKGDEDEAERTRIILNSSFTTIVRQARIDSIDFHFQNTLLYSRTLESLVKLFWTGSYC